MEWTKDPGVSTQEIFYHHFCDGVTELAENGEKLKIKFVLNAHELCN
jgi:hypothetical protein